MTPASDGKAEASRRRPGAGRENIFSMERRVASALNIVIVEESCLSRNVLVKALRGWGFACTVAEKEDAAWAAILAAPAPVLVLADWHCDFLECDEFFERIRGRAFLHGLYIIGGIPRGAVGAIRRCVMAGADDFLLRPYDLDEVRVRLHIAAKVMGLAPDGPVFPIE